MRVYVLGAGASCHAGFPLGSKLRQQLEAWASTRPENFGKPFSALTEMYGATESLDSILTDLYERPPGSRGARLLDRHPSLLADVIEAFRQFFSEIHQREIQCHHAADYSGLASLMQPGDTVITFNYDLALERQLKRVPDGLWEVGDGYGFDIGLGAASPSKVKVLKLHGSISWYATKPARSVGLSMDNRLVRDRPVLGLDPEMDYVGYQSFRDPAIGSRVPTGTAVILPVAHKKFYYETTDCREWEEFWDNLWNAAEASLESCDEIVIIGYSLPNADERARELLLCRANKNARVIVCCGNDSCRIKEELRDHGFRSFLEAPDSFHQLVQGAGGEIPR